MPLVSYTYYYYALSSSTMSVNINSTALVNFVSEEDLYKIPWIVNFLNEDVDVWYVHISHMCPILAEWIAAMLFNPQDNGLQKFIFFTGSTYRILRGLVEHDYLKVISMRAHNETPEDICDHHPICVGYCVCGAYTGMENIY